MWRRLQNPEDGGGRGETALVAEAIPAGPRIGDMDLVVRRADRDLRVDGRLGEARLEELAEPYVRRIEEDVILACGSADDPGDWRAESIRTMRPTIGA